MAVALGPSYTTSIICRFIGQVVQQQAVRHLDVFGSCVFVVAFDFTCAVQLVVDLRTACCTTDRSKWSVGVSVATRGDVAASRRCLAVCGRVDR